MNTVQLRKPSTYCSLFRSLPVTSFGCLSPTFFIFSFSSYLSLPPCVPLNFYLFCSLHISLYAVLPKPLIFPAVSVLFSPFLCLRFTYPLVYLPLCITCFQLFSSALFISLLAPLCLFACVGLYVLYETGQGVAH